MKVEIKKYEEKGNYEKGISPEENLVKKSIGEALSYARSIIRENKKTEDFVGFRIYTLRGEFKHKLHNQ